MPDARPIRIVERIYSSLHTPACHRTEAGWLREGFRVVGNAAAQLLVLHERQHNRRRSPDEPVPVEEIAALRLRLEESEHPSDEDRRLVARLDAACQVSWCNLYPPGSVARIEKPRQSEAWALLSDLWRCGTHRTQFIFGGQDEAGQKWCYTAGGRIARDWDIRDHKKGTCFLGVKRGDSTKVIDIDLDRHTGKVPAADHVRRVLATLRWLQANLPELAWHVTNINPRNGSCHLTGYLPRAIPVAQARAVVSDIRSACPWLEGVEIYPDNQCQFLLPLRRDKVTVIDRVLTPSIKSWRKEAVAGIRRKKGRKPRKIRREYLAMDAAAYWQWINDGERKPCDLALVEAELRKACACLADAGDEAKAGRTDRTLPAKKPFGDGMAPLGKMRGRLARQLVAFWSGKGDRPDDSTATKWTTMTLRVLVLVEGMARDDAVAWVLERLRPLRNQAGDGPLVHDAAEMARVVKATADAVADGNGYQADPEASSAVWAKVKAAWAASGFRLADEATWTRARRVVHADVPDLDWSPRLLALLPALAVALKIDDLDLARRTLAAVCWQVEVRSELSLSYLAGMMRELGVKGYADKAVAVRRLLEATGVVRLVKRGFRFGEDGVGNFYELAEDVGFAFPSPPEAGSPSRPGGKEVSTYPSSPGLDVLPLVRRKRRRRCLDRYHDRLRGLGGGFRQAA